MIITETAYGYEVKTSDGRYFSVSCDGKKAKQFRASEKYIMTGRTVHGIPAHIKSIVFKLQKNEN